MKAFPVYVMIAGLCVCALCVCLSLIRVLLYVSGVFLRGPDRDEPAQVPQRALLRARLANQRQRRPLMIMPCECDLLSNELVCCVV